MSTFLMISKVHVARALVLQQVSFMAQPAAVALAALETPTHTPLHVHTADMHMHIKCVVRVKAE